VGLFPEVAACGGGLDPKIPVPRCHPRLGSGPRSSRGRRRARDSHCVSGESRVETTSFHPLGVRERRVGPRGGRIRDAGGMGAPEGPLSASGDERSGDTRIASWTYDLKERNDTVVPGTRRSSTPGGGWKGRVEFGPEVRGSDRGVLGPPHLPEGANSAERGARYGSHKRRRFSVVLRTRGAERDLVNCTSCHVTTKKPSRYEFGDLNGTSPASIPLSAVNDRNSLPECPRVDQQASCAGFHVSGSETCREVARG